jgi:hypothetical protein
MVEQRYRFPLTEAEFNSILNARIENDLPTVPLSQRPGHPGEKLERFGAVSRQLFALTIRTKGQLPIYTRPFPGSSSADDPSNPVHKQQ